MKASERLRELADAWFRNPEDPNYGARQVHIVGNALPLIADVVKAAEQAAKFSDKRGIACQDALTALREALEKN